MFDALVTRTSRSQLVSGSKRIQPRCTAASRRCTQTQDFLGILRLVQHSKRQVVSGLLRRLRQELKVAAAEVGELDRWQLAEIAIVTVSGDGRQADRVLAAALSFVEAHADGAQVADVSTELVPM